MASVGACLISRSGPDSFVLLLSWPPPQTILFLGATYRITTAVTHGGWHIYRQETDHG